MRSQSWLGITLGITSLIPASIITLTAIAPTLAQSSRHADRIDAQHDRLIALATRAGFEAAKAQTMPLHVNSYR